MELKVTGLCEKELSGFVIKSISRFVNTGEITSVNPKTDEVKTKKKKVPGRLVITIFLNDKSGIEYKKTNDLVEINLK